MAEESVIVSDSLGNVIYFSSAYLSQLEEKLREDIVTALQKPALIIEENVEHRLMHYYRSVDWHETMLVTAFAANHHWEPLSFQRNPSPDLLANLLRNGRQLL